MELFIIIGVVVLGVGFTLVLCYLAAIAFPPRMGNTNEIRTMQLEWEQIDPCRQRAKVPGGWFVEVRDRPTQVDMALGLRLKWGLAAFFYPDPNHEWDID